MTYVPGPGMAAPPAAPAPDVRPLLDDGTCRVMTYRCSGHPGLACWQDHHRDWALVLAGAGGFVYRTADRTHLIEPGMAIVTRPGQPFQCDHPFGAGDEALVITLPGPPARPDGPPDGALLPPVATVAGLTRAVHTPTPDRRHLLAAVTALIDSSSVVPSVATDPDDWLSGHALLSDLAAIGDAGPPLDDLGRGVGLSRFGVNRLVRRLTGLSPHQYRIQRRLAAAVELLRTTDRTITTIAADVGWDDLSTFLHAFRQHIGCSPGAFRRQA